MRARHHNNPGNSLGTTRNRLPFSRVLFSIAKRDETSLAGKPPKPSKPRAMCPYCGHVGAATGGGQNYSHDLTTGYCLAAKACLKRRAELDDETIEFLGLVPRQ